MTEESMPLRPRSTFHSNGTTPSTLSSSTSSPDYTYGCSSLEIGLIQQEHGLDDGDANGGTTTAVEAGISLAKAIMGAGSFALPWAFSKMGYIAGPIYMTILMILSVYSLIMLVRCSRCYAAEMTNNNSSSNTSSSLPASYVDLARAAFGKTGSQLSYAASMSASIGVCGSYLIFIAANLNSLLSSSSSIRQGTLIMTVLPVAILLSSVKNMKYFAFVSLLGNVSVVLGMFVVLIYGLLYHSISITKAGENCVAIASIETMPLAFGTIGYLFLVHFLVLPIESSMEKPEQFEKVAIITFSLCALISGIFGVICYLLFGSDTQQIVLLNVQGSYFISAVQLLLCFDLLFTYPVIMRPSIVIVEKTLSSKIQRWLSSSSSSPLTSSSTSSITTINNKLMVAATTTSSTTATRMIVCAGLGLIAAGASIFVPAFGLLSGLVGGVSQTFLALVLPPLMLTKLQESCGSSINNSYTIIDVVIASSSKDIKRILLVSFGMIMISWTLFSTWNELKEEKIDS